MTDDIWVSKGQSHYVGGVITETTGDDISGDQIVVGLGTYYEPPDQADTGAPDDDIPGTTTTTDGQTLHTRTIKQLIDHDTPLGDGQQLWAWVTDNPEVEPIRLGDPFNVR